MCRHLAYWGPPTDLAELVLDAPHSLAVQAEQAREMPWGHDNLDGWGFGWVDATGRVERYRSAAPLPVDDDGRSMLKATRAGRFVAHVRQKTPGATTDASGSAPFWDGGTTLFTHNGYVEGFRAGVEEELRSRLSWRRRDALEGDADSEVLFGLVLDRMAAGAAPEDALGVLVEVARRYGGRYNVLLLTPECLVATTWGTSLYLDRTRGTRVASEPLDHGPWEPVPDHHRVVVRDGRTRLEAW